jgi:uncharacterized integral membrane protein (TIGR00697 family)
MRIYDITVVLFVVVLLVSNIVSTKIVGLGPFTFDGGTLLFPIVYIFGDVLTEVYGFKLARRAIWLGFSSLFFMVAVFWLIGALPAAGDWGAQGAYETILLATPRIALGSMIAYWFGSISNSYIMARMKVWTSGRHLWARTIGSTVVGEMVDTLLFCMIAFYGLFPGELLISIIVSNYIFKVLYEVTATPLTYTVIKIYKRVEQRSLKIT